MNVTIGQVDQGDLKHPIEVGRTETNANGSGSRLQMLAEPLNYRDFGGPTCPKTKTSVSNFTSPLQYLSTYFT